MSITNCLIGKFVSKEELPPGKVSRFVPTLYYTAKFNKFQYLDEISQISFFLSLFFLRLYTVIDLWPILYRPIAKA